MSERQSIVFFKKYGWNKAKSKKWLDLHNLHPIKDVDEHISSELRYRMNDPKKYSHFTSQKLNNGIQIVLGWKGK
jgi:hypothetical protein